MISGFILNWVYLSSEKPVVWRSFYIARAARILPLYFLTTLVMLPKPLWSMFRDGLQIVGSGYPEKLLANLLVVSGIINGWRGTINFPAWAISVEIFCYLLLIPFLFGLQGYLKKHPWQLVIFTLFAIILMGIFVWSGSIQPVQLTSGISWDYQWLVRGIVGVSCGFFVCSLYRAFRSWCPSTVLFKFIGVMLGILFVLALFLPDGIFPPHFLLYLFPLILFSTAADVGPVSAVLTLRPLQWLGDRSYSIYLCHIPLITCFAEVLASRHLSWIHPSHKMNFLVMIVVVLIVADLSYRYFETPCRDYLRNRKK
jgi:peptidoglycan/LPS O-acetylase OafA/YrhL